MDGPYQPFIGSRGAALQLHRTGLSLREQNSAVIELTDRGPSCHWLYADDSLLCISNVIARNFRQVPPDPSYFTDSGLRAHFFPLFQQYPECVWFSFRAASPF